MPTWLLGLIAFVLMSIFLALLLLDYILNFLFPDDYNRVYLITKLNRKKKYFMKTKGLNFLTLLDKEGYIIDRNCIINEGFFKSLYYVEDNVNPVDFFRRQNAADNLKLWNDFINTKISGMFEIKNKVGIEILIIVGIVLLVIVGYFIFKTQSGTP